MYIRYSVSAGRLSKHLNTLVNQKLLLKKEDGYHAYYKTNYKAYKGNNTTPDLTRTETETAERTA